ncbi:helix-turn-helix transcriptional regulator [Ancylobacter sp. 3268]|uniref:helix-turn-helix domain-containing protein n=1 Tax=Ancylobacter sp. 3268 TaxID=2817752 RepID=UPI00286B10F4|nr:helix-turn-helix transcriptional regulator [Ancylobacter sp. 3268]
MELFATQLRKRAEELGISHAEVARRAGLTERRYGNYVAGTREPDLATLVRIATVLSTSTDWLLGLGAGDVEQTHDAVLRSRLMAAAAGLSTDDLSLFIIQAEAIVDARRRQEPHG